MSEAGVLMAVEVLPVQDAALWWVQRPDSPLQIAGLAVFEASPLRDATGALRIEDLTARVEASLARTPRFRQCVRQLPLVLGVAWEDDQDFAVARHVRTAVVRAPGEDPELRCEVSRVLGLPLDPTHPLWEVWLLDGLAGDRVAVVLKASHVLLDGMALLEVAMRLLDAVPEPPERPPPPSWHPDRPSGGMTRLLWGVSTRVAQSVEGLRQAGLLLGDGRIVAGAAGAVARMVTGVGEGDETRPPLTGRVGPRRDTVWTRISLDDVRRVARAESVTVNDVVLTVAAGALARYLDAHPAEVPSRDPRILVPVSVHGSDAGDDGDNRFSVVVTQAPLGRSDPRERLQHVHAELQRLKGGVPTALGSRVFALAGLVSPWLLRHAGRAALDHQTVVDLAVTNLPGPRTPMYLMGARMLEVFPLVGGTGNIATIIGVLSYCDSLGVSVTVDADVVHDPEVLLAGFPMSLCELVDATVGGR